MAVSVDDLTSPAGPLERAVLFPADTQGQFEDRLAAYIADGVTRAAALEDDEQDDAVMAWARHRARQAAYEMRLFAPSSASLADEGSASWTASQIEAMKALADADLAEFEELVGAVTEDEDTTAGGWPVISSWRRAAS